MKKKGVFLILAIVLISGFASVVSEPTVSDNVTEKQIEIASSSSKAYINITVQEAWTMMNTTDDGYQIPIDIRRLEEYLNERIILPDGSDWIRWFPYELTSDGPGPIVNEGLFLRLFINYYQGKEIIIYCRTARRSGIAAEILVDHGFSGTVYNVMGGITEWKTAGFPTTPT